MTDVNEEIVKVYYEAQGYLVKTNHYYVKQKISKEGKKTGQGASDIDLIIMHPQTKDRAIVSVKGWQNDVVLKSNINKKWKNKDKEKLKIDNQTLSAGKSFFGNDSFKTILIISCIEKENYQELKRDLEEFYNYDLILDFPTILHDLIEGNKEKNIPEFDEHKNYRDSEFLQTLRLLIKHYIKKQNGKKHKQRI